MRSRASKAEESPIDQVPRSILHARSERGAVSRSKTTVSLMTTWGDGEIARLRTVTPSCVPHALGKREMLVDGALGVVLVEDVFGCRSGSLALHSYGHTRGTNDAAYGKLLSPANAHVGRSPPFTETTPDGAGTGAGPDRIQAYLRDTRLISTTSRTITKTPIGHIHTPPPIHPFP